MITFLLLLQHILFAFSFGALGVVVFGMALYALDKEALFVSGRRELNLSIMIFLILFLLAL